MNSSKTYTNLSLQTNNSKMKDVLLNVQLKDFKSKEIRLSLRSKNLILRMKWLLLTYLKCHIKKKKHLFSMTL